MTKSAFVTALILTAALPLQAHDLLPNPRQRTIDVSGSASIRVVPDEVVVGVGVETFAPTVGAATSANDTAIRSILAALKSLGVRDQNVRTEAMSLEVAYRQSDHPSRGIEGYFARKTLTLTLSDAGTAERAVNASLTNGANRIFGIRYNTTKMRELRDEAREKASRAALEKARALAGHFGAELGGPLSIREGYSLNYGGSMWNSYGYGSGMMQSQNVTSSRGGGESQDPEGTIPAGEMAVRAEVSVSFALKD